MKTNQFRFYATLLDSFLWYEQSESEFAEQEFLNRINRVEETDAEKIWNMGRGTALNNLVDKGIVESGTILEGTIRENVGLNMYEFEADVVNELCSKLYGSASQIYTEMKLNVSGADVLLYGYIDYLRDKCVDLKTTKEYILGKYKNSMQLHLYPLSLSNDGVFVDEFEFLVVEFSSRGTNIFSETYKCDLVESKAILTETCERLIHFIESKRDLITDTKIFGIEPNTFVATHDNETNATMIEKI